MRKRVLLVNSMLDPIGVEVLAREVEVIERPTVGSEGLVEAAANIHGILVRSPGKVTRAVMQSSSTLEVVAAPGAGLDPLDFEAATELGIPVVHCPGLGATAVAEHALGLMLALARNFTRMDRELRRNMVWAQRISNFQGTELEGKVLGLVGLGHIGREVAAKCRLAFHMTVLAYDPYVSAEQAQAWGVAKVDDLHTLMNRADFVSIHVPITKETRGLIDQNALAHMKPTAYLVNTARGAIIDETALVEALRNGQLAGAGLDVYAHEPPVADHPYFALDNTILSAHVAGITKETAAKVSTAIAEQILQVLRGEQPPYLANPQVWPGFLARHASARSEAERIGR